MSGWLLVEVRGPWGRDAVAQSELGPFAPRVWREAMRRHGTRVIAIRRNLDQHRDHEHTGMRLVHVNAPRPGVRAAAAHRLVVGGLHEVVSATEPLVAGRGVDGRWEPDEDRYVLVCTNGRHDACCATFGRPLVRYLRESPWADEVWECSHIGGDRFAANIVLLPDSLYFGNVDEHRAADLLRAHDASQLDLTCYRGRSTLRLPEQAAEHAARVELGLAAVDAIVGARTLDDGAVDLDLSDGRRVVVQLRRVEHAAPTPLTCKGKSGLAYPEFQVSSLDVIERSA